MHSDRTFRYLAIIICLLATLGWGVYRVIDHLRMAGPRIEAEENEFKPLKTLAELNLLPHAKKGEGEEFLNASYLYLMSQYWSNKKNGPRAIKYLERALAVDPDASELHLALAKEYLALGRVEEGIEETKKSIELNPDDRESLLLMGNLQVTAKKFSEARVLFKKLNEKYPEDEEILLTWVLLEIDDQNFGRAHALLKSFLQENPTSAPALFYMGRLEQSRGRTEQAIAAFEKALELHPSYVQAATYLAVLLEESGKNERALMLYQWLADETGEAGFEKRVAQIFMDRNQYEKALERLLRYEEKDPSDLNNKVKIALIYIEQKDFEKAVAKLEDILSLSPDSDNIRFYLAAVHQQQEDFKKAAIQYGKVSRSSKLFPEAFRGYIFSMRKMDKKKAAWERIQETLEYAKKSDMETEYIYEIGISFLDDTEQGDRAEKFLDEALLEHPESTTLTYQKATFLEKAGKVSEAIELAREILEKDPNNVAALNFVGYLLADSNQKLAEAEKLIRKALEFRPQDPFIMDSLGWVLFRRGRVDEALKYLKTALSMRPDESIIADHIGDVLLKKGEAEEALTYYEKALTLGPDRENERKRLEAKLENLRKSLAGGVCASNPRSSSCFDGVLHERSPAQTPDH